MGALTGRRLTTVSNGEIGYAQAHRASYCTSVVCYAVLLRAAYTPLLLSGKAVCWAPKVAKQRKCSSWTYRRVMREKNETHIGDVHGLHVSKVMQIPWQGVCRSQGHSVADDAHIRALLACALGYFATGHCGDPPTA